jgi:hypothetical protein
MGRRETLVGFVGALLLVSTAAAQQPPPVSKFVTPFKGEAPIEMMPATGSTAGGVMITKFKVKNMAPGPLIGFKVSEYWYSPKNEPVSGSQAFRVMKPLLPGEVVEVTLKSPRPPDGSRKITQFEHQNGKVKVKEVKKFSS